MTRCKIFGTVLVAVMVMLAMMPIDICTAQDRGFNRPGERMEIEQLTTTYAWAIDDKNLDALMSIFVEGEPPRAPDTWYPGDPGYVGDEVYPIYDISALQIPGLDRVEGTTAIRGFMEFAVIPGEPWAFSSISNVDILFTGDDTAEGGDYYIHDGYVPVKVAGKSHVIKKRYSQFDPSTYDLLCDPDTLVRSYKEGQHLYEFIRTADEEWKIHVFISSPTFSAEDVIISVDQISPAKKPWHPMFDAMADCD